MSLFNPAFRVFHCSNLGSFTVLIDKCYQNYEKNENKSKKYGKNILTLNIELSNWNTSKTLQNWLIFDCFEFLCRKTLIL